MLFRINESESIIMGLGIVVVEVCTRNQMNIDKLDEIEDKFPEVAVMRTDCLNHCNLCRARPYAFVNEKRVFEKTPEECMETIEKTVEAELKEFFGEM